MEKLKRSQLEVRLLGCMRVLAYDVDQDKLEHALQHRPKPDELVKEGILRGA